MKKMKKIKEWIIKLVRKYGYDIVKIKPRSYLSDGYASHYESSLLSLLSKTEKLNIIVVGANDGMVGDPIYDFVRLFPERTRLLLVEPQKELIPQLEENYAFHPDYKVFHGAVGPEKKLKLYSVDKSAWKYVSKKRQKDWPEHRASTGRTSPDRQILKKWLETITDDDMDVDEMISEDVVPCKKLCDILEASDFAHTIDVLQVDTEGFDDQVIYNADIDDLQPNVILFEISLLGEQRLKRVKSYLREKGYFISNLKRDAIAFKTS